MSRNTTTGFTLLEMSLVLVIIGLIAGGVLVGRDMIHTAALRSTVAQLGKYNAAVNAFREKYGGIPGDITSDAATAFSLFPGTGDSNGIITQNSFGTGPGVGPPYNASAWGLICGSEPLVFWRHLSDAKLIDGAYGYGDGSATLSATGFVTSDTSSVGSFLPAAKTGNGAHIAVFSSPQAQNYFIVISLKGIFTNGNVFDDGGGYLSPMNTHNIDAKMDDGMPNMGAVVAGSDFINFPTPSFAPVSTPATCMVGSGYTDVTASYNLNPATGGNDLSCSFAARFN